MNLLLDTHVLLWWLDNHPSLGSRAREAIAEGQNLAFVSAATIWEIRIKQALGKLEIPANFQEVLKAEPFLSLDVTAEHAHEVANLPMLHRDPFDRILIAQARVEHLAVITADSCFEGYRVPVIQASSAR